MLEDPDGQSQLNMSESIKPSFQHSPCSLNIPFVLSSEKSHQIHGNFNQYLRDYQRDGVKFLYDHYTDSNGALLGDDMGLGKTIQVIALLSALLHKTGTEKDIYKFKPDVIRKHIDPDFNKEVKFLAFLLIVPASLIQNWTHEFNVWGYFSFAKFHGNDRTSALDLLKRRKIEIVITTFEAVRSHINELNAFEWNAAFVDEVHKIKEPKSAVTKALKHLNCKSRFGLTGTVLQNSVKELWCLLDWANPSCLGLEKTFKEHFVRVIEQGSRHDASKRQLAESRRKQRIFHKILTKWMIRRTKSLIKDQLPKKVDKVVFCRPSDLQKKIYKKIIESNEIKLILNQSKQCTCGSRKKQIQCCYKKSADGHNIKSLTFAFMQLLLKVANHLMLVFQSRKNKKHSVLSSEKISLFVEDLTVLKELKSSHISAGVNENYCGKIRVLMDLLSIFKKRNSKILMFSYSIKILDIVERYVMTSGYEYRRIDGKTKSDLRFQYATEFNSDSHIFICLLSTKVGGVGLNMTGANIVIIFDPNWNPAHELQAQDRAYRIGQHQDVEVYRFISSGTIEENMYLRQIYKQQLEKSVIASENATRYFKGPDGAGHNKSEIFGIESIFSFNDEKTCQTESILKRHHQVVEKLSSYTTTNYVIPEDKEYEEFADFDDSDSPVDISEVEDNGQPKIPQRDLTVSQVLMSKNVMHVHANQDVVGVSRAENHMTECAIQDVLVDNQFSQMPASVCKPLKKRMKRKRKRQTIDSKKGNFILGKTPPFMQKKHFDEMVRLEGSSSEELSSKILSMTETEVESFLLSFYSKYYHTNVSNIFQSFKTDNQSSSEEVADANLINEPLVCKISSAKEDIFSNMFQESSAREILPLKLNLPSISSDEIGEKYSGLLDFLSSSNEDEKAIKDSKQHSSRISISPNIFDLSDSSNNSEECFGVSKQVDEFLSQTFNL